MGLPPSHSLFVDASGVHVKEDDEAGEYYEMLSMNRGIPGVQSDLYHMGFFEDKTAHRSDTQRRHSSQSDCLIEAMTIFALLLLGYTLVTCIAFGIREYTWSLQNRRKLLSNGSMWSNRSVVLNGLTGNLNDMRRGVEEQKDPEYEQDGLQDDGRIDVVRLSPNHSPSSLNKWIMRKAKSDHLNKITYELDELLSFKPAEFDGIPLLSQRLIKSDTIALTISSSVQLKPLRFHSAETAEKTVEEICIGLSSRGGLDPLSKKITLLRLISLLANCCSMENSTIFLQSFNETMDFIIDTGEIFELLKQVNTYLARSLIEMVIQYCYSHWSFGESNDSRILELFRVHWKHPDPIAQSHAVLIRYLINMRLGLYTVQGRLDRDTLIMTVSKTKALLRHMISHSSMLDATSIIPIFKQAVEFTEDSELTKLCYSLLLRLVELQTNGDIFTIPSMVRDQDANLKYLIQSGLWVRNARSIRDKTERICEILARRMPVVQDWYDEVHGGSVSVIDTAPTAGTQTYNLHSIANGNGLKGLDPLAERPLRPGSWKTNTSSNISSPVRSWTYN